MSELSTKPVEPTASPLPPKPEADPLTASQWRTLLAFADATIPSIAPKSIAKAKHALLIDDNEYSTALSTLQQDTLRGGREELAKQYLAERPSNIPAFKESIWRFVGLHVPSDAKMQLLTVFSLLE